MRIDRTLALSLALAGSASGCTYWHRADGALSQSLAKRDRVQIWIGRTAHDVHGVVAHGDSLTAIPYWKHPDCDSCRVALARSDVDSVRAVKVSGETFLIASVGVMTLLIVHISKGLASNYP